MNKFTIAAEVHSDDFVMKAQFDAEPWFLQASDAEIIALQECGWGGDQPADELARDAAEGNVDVDKVLEYCVLVDTVGFECHIDADQAIAWIKTNRPHIDTSPKEPRFMPHTHPTGDDYIALMNEIYTLNNAGVTLTDRGKLLILADYVSRVGSIEDFRAFCSQTTADMPSVPNKEWLSLCKHCDHFVDLNDGADEDLAAGYANGIYDPLNPPLPGTNTAGWVSKYIHLEDGEQEFDHDAEPGETRPDGEWNAHRPDLFLRHEDDKIGPNSIFHSRRGKIDS